MLEWEFKSKSLCPGSIFVFLAISYNVWEHQMGQTVMMILSIPCLVPRNIEATHVIPRASGRDPTALENRSLSDTMDHLPRLDYPISHCFPHSEQYEEYLRVYLKGQCYVANRALDGDQGAGSLVLTLDLLELGLTLPICKVMNLNYVIKVSF